jgi:hypothetical protein
LPQKKQESENKEWVKLSRVTLSQSHKGQNEKNLQEKNRRNRAIHPRGIASPQQHRYTDHRAEYHPR